MNAQFDGAIEHSLLAIDGEAVDVDIHLGGDDARHVYQDAHTVDALNADGGVEEVALVHVPFGIEDAVAKAGFQLGSHRTAALVDFYLSLAVDESQHVVTRNGVAAVLEFILVDVLVADEDGFLAIEIVGHHKESLLLRAFCLLLLTLSEEGHQLAPAFLGATAVLARQLVDILLAQQDGLVAYRLQEILAVARLVELHQDVDSIGGVLNVIFLQELGQQLLSLLLLLATVTAQDGLNLGLGLGRAHEVDPGGLHMLRVGGENLHLVAALQLMAQGHQLVVHLGTDTMRAQEGVYGEGEVESRTARRHGLDLALGREDEYL